MHGQGMLQHGNERYDGQFRNNLFHGDGSCKMKNGDTYEGGYCDGQRHGQGKYEYRGGNTYYGQWKHDKYHGEGTHLTEGNGPRGNIALKPGNCFKFYVLEIPPLCLVTTCGFKVNRGVAGGYFVYGWHQTRPRKPYGHHPH